MQFKDIIEGLLEGKSYTYTHKDSDVHFFVLLATPVNEEAEFLCICFFEDMEDAEDDIDPECLELNRTDLEHDLWREVVAADYYTEEDPLHD